MEIHERMLVVVTNLYTGLGGTDPMGMGYGTDPLTVDTLGIVTKVDRENKVAEVETKGYGCFTTIPFEELIPLAEYVPEECTDPEGALRDLLPEVIVKIARQANGTSRALTGTIMSLAGRD